MNQCGQSRALRCFLFSLVPNKKLKVDDSSGEEHFLKLSLVFYSNLQNVVLVSDIKGLLFFFFVVVAKFAIILNKVTVLSKIEVFWCMSVFLYMCFVSSFMSAGSWLQIIETCFSRNWRRWRSNSQIAVGLSRSTVRWHSQSTRTVGIHSSMNAISSILQNYI